MKDRRLIVDARLANIYTPGGDLHFEGLDYWAELVERAASYHSPFPELVKEKGGTLVTFRSGVRRLAFDGLWTDSVKLAEDEWRRHPSLTQAEASTQDMSWDGALQNHLRR